MQDREQNWPACWSLPESRATHFQPRPLSQRLTFTAFPVETLNTFTCDLLFPI